MSLNRKNCFGLGARPQMVKVYVDSSRRTRFLALGTPRESRMIIAQTNAEVTSSPCAEMMLEIFEKGVRSCVLRRGKGRCEGTMCPCDGWYANMDKEKNCRVGVDSTSSFQSVLSRRHLETSAEDISIRDRRIVAENLKNGSLPDWEHIHFDI